MAISLPVAEPPIRVMALHALLYCERLFYLEEVEEIRVADARVYAGRNCMNRWRWRKRGEFRDRGGGQHIAGLFGKIDAIKRRDGLMLPYEHKRGRCRRRRIIRRWLWPSDRVQVLAYAMMLEETLGGRCRRADSLSCRQCDRPRAGGRCGTWRGAQRDWPGQGTSRGDRPAADRGE